MKIKITPVFALLFATFSLFAQDDTSKATMEVDASKPTNLYTQINANLEGSFSDAVTKYGIRFNVQYALNPDNLFMAELPFMYNDQTSKFGIADSRLRYFAVIKRNITKRLIAFAPFTDITIPTGSYVNGLGGSSWSFAVATVFGFLASSKLALFPGISYVYITKSATSIIPDNLKYAGNGIGLHFNASYSFSKKNLCIY